MKEDYSLTLLRLRLSVGFLGEKSQFSWWETSFFEVSSEAFLNPVLPRTKALGRYHGVVEAARRMHDEHLSSGTYHLFRLPEEIEQDLHVLLYEGGVEEWAARSIENSSEALGTLGELAGNNTTYGEKAGPVLVGNIGSVADPDVLATMAGIYRAAFEKRGNSFPYFMEQP